MTTHKVLIPLDGSEFSRQIVPSALRFLRSDDTEIILLRVAPLPEGITGPPPRQAVAEVWGAPAYESERDLELAQHPIYRTQVWSSLEAALGDELQAEARPLREAGYRVTTAVRFGHPAEEIVTVARDESVDLVAMVTHARSGLSRVVRGSVAEEVLHGVSVPVMLIRASERPRTRIAAGEILAHRLAEGQSLRLAVITDGYSLAQIATIAAGEVARTLNAELTLLVAVHDESEVARNRQILSAARDLLGDLSAVHGPLPLTRFNYEVALARLASMPVDLLIIGPFEDRSPSSPYSVGLTARRLVQLAPTSVLVAKGEAPTFGRILACTGVGDDVVVDVAAHLANAVGAELRLLHVVGLTADECLAHSEGVDIPLSAVFEQATPEARYLKACVARLDELGFDHEAVTVRCGALPEAIFEEAREGDFDLIVVGSRTRPEYFLGSLADRVVRYAPRSVLIVRTA